MLHAMLAKIKTEIPDALFAMEPTINAPRNKQLKYGIYTKTSFRKLKIPFKYVFAFIPRVLRRRWHYINENEIGVVLDASGFAFGDVWGAKKAADRLGNHVVKWKKQGKKIILMPQAFGPFSDPGLVRVMKVIISYSDIIFVRDQISLKYLEDLDANNKKFIPAPDFTNLIKGTVPAYFDSAVCEVAIVVNSKMIETKTGEEGRAYLDLLHRLIIIIRNLGYKPYFLIHEEKRDSRVADMINNTLAKPLPVIREDDPLHVKGMIGKSKAVINSRFHSLVSSLSQGIPCLATGWSHKYELLLKDYNYEEGMLDVYCDNDLLLQKVTSVLAASKYRIIDKLEYGIATQKERSEEMWKVVFRKTGHDKFDDEHYSLKPDAVSQKLLLKDV